MSGSFLMNFTVNSLSCTPVSQFILSVFSDYLQPHWLQHARPPYPTQFPEPTQTHVRWVGDAIQPSHPLSSPSSHTFNLSPHQGLFPGSWFFTSGDQSIRVSASASVLPMNIQNWFPLGLIGWICLLSKGLKSLIQHHNSKASVLRHSAFFYTWNQCNTVHTLYFNFKEKNFNLPLEEIPMEKKTKEHKQILQQNMEKYSKDESKLLKNES